ncbi:MAG: HD domain-containing phosphohydrolase, partial [Actinomycetota bacterium]
GAQPRALAITPLLSGDGLSGWITVREPAGSNDHFTEERLRLLETLSYQASAAMRKALLYKDQKETADIANALLDFGAELASAEGLDQVLTRTVELSARILGCPRVAVLLQEVETGDLLVEALSGFEGPERHELASVRFPADHARDFLSPDKPFSVRPEELGPAHPIRSVISDPLVAVAPLKLDGRTGAIVAGAPAYGDYEFSERKMKLLAGIANQAVLAVSNASNFEILERTFLSTVEALANALEAKDEYTSSHARSITDMALEVGYSLSLDARTLKRLELGALFHDIGKIGIPSDILLKPGPLTDDERKVIETHPELGERILAPIDRLEDVRPIVRHCHEHFDGSGYPDGRKGDEIPVESRIILVCDAFHAMTTDRPYRKRLSQEEALRRLNESSGRQFDPRVVNAFVRLVKVEAQTGLNSSNGLWQSSQ